MVHYVFDVDGTLTPSRQKINDEFGAWFLKFANKNEVSLVSGSDYSKTLQQLGEEILSSVKYSFNCSGNAIYKDGELIHENSWKAPDNLMEYLKSVVFKSEYENRTGKHYDHRIGCLNFSVVGRNAIGKDRTDYYEWDLKHKERSTVAKYINENFIDLKAVIGGETGVDIFPLWHDKSQILAWIPNNIVFFGDRTDEEGNDYPLSHAILTNELGTVHKVENWTETWKILKSL